MNANETIREILSRENASTTSVSREMGHAKTYLNTLLAKNRAPGTSVMAQFCEAVGYELIARNKEDGFEFVIGP